MNLKESLRSHASIAREWGKMHLAKDLDLAADAVTVWHSTNDALPKNRKPVMVDGGPAYRDGAKWFSMVESPHRPITWVVERWAELPTAPPR